MKRILTMAAVAILVLVFMFGLSSCSKHETNKEDICIFVDNIYYRIRDGVAEVAEQNAYIELANIAASIEYKSVSYRVKSISENAFLNCSELTNVEIPSSIESIGFNAFAGCSSLRYNEYDNAYYLGNSDNPYMALITVKAFDIDSCSVHNDTKVVCTSAFFSCSKLTNITVDKINTVYKSIDGNLYSKNGKILIKYASGKTDISFTVPSNVTNISNRAFGGCINLKNVSFDYKNSKLASIDNYAFIGCSNLSSIEIPKNVEIIGDAAFSFCVNLKIVKFKERSKLVSINPYAFYNCKELAYIEIPESIVNIDGSAFLQCSNLQYNEYNNAYYLGNIDNPYVVLMEVKSADVKSLVIHSDTKVIKSLAFDNCINLTYINIPSNIINIGYSALSNCKNLMMITVENNNKSYKSIDGNLFSKDCKKLTQYAIGKTDTNFVIPSHVTDVGEYAFKDCTNLTSIEIPSNIERIGDGAFSGCVNLSNVNFDENCKLTDISKDAFKDCTNLTSIEIPSNIERIGDSAFSGCVSLSNVNLKTNFS